MSGDHDRGIDHTSAAFQLRFGDRSPRSSFVDQPLQIADGHASPALSFVLSEIDDQIVRLDRLAVRGREGVHWFGRRS